MKIKSLQLKNFKRFTDLTLKDIPDNAKLVLLIGSNGSGKSSVFDAFAYLANQNKKAAPVNVLAAAYDVGYRKDPPHPEEIILETEYGQEGLIGGAFVRSNKIEATSFYGRTSFRQIPRLTRRSLGTNFNIISDNDRPPSFIDRDERFENDLEHIYGRLLREYFTNNDRSKITKEVIDPINSSFERIFGNSNGTRLRLKEVIPPLEGNIAQINFQKGNSTFHYNYLSAGEKEVFNILINLIARREYYTDTIFFYDEIDLHLNTRLQYNFLKELVEFWIPQNCQFWTASHSLGFIQYAKDSEQAVIFDLDDYDFDEIKVLVPQAKDSSDIYEIAVSREILPSLFKDYTVYFVENKDRNYYSSLNIPHVLFVQANNKKAVYHKVKNGEFHGIIDRDFLTDGDIKEVEKQYLKLKRLRLYSIENYLYHPDNLEEYYSTRKEPYSKQEYKSTIAMEKEAVFGEIRRKLALVRMTYPFFEEPEFSSKANQKRFRNESENLAQVEELEKYLSSSEFDVFYKVFPMKDYATQLKERQNINKSDLSKTNWFKKQIEALLK
ncbi:MAG TPA: AAA family ATPase [Puia sp.]|nr:AAA family ATPase [Puia sp.]